MRPIIHFSFASLPSQSFGVSTREFLRIHTYGEVNKNPIYGSIIVITSIVLVTLFLLLAPNSVQPIASYIAFSLLLLLPLLFVLFICINNFRKKYFTPQMPDNERGDDNEDCDESRRQSSATTAVQSPEEHKLSICSVPNTIYALMTSPSKKTAAPPAYQQVRAASKWPNMPSLQSDSANEHMSNKNIVFDKRSSTAIHSIVIYRWKPRFYCMRSFVYLFWLISCDSLLTLLGFANTLRSH